MITFFYYTDQYAEPHLGPEGDLRPVTSIHWIMPTNGTSFLSMGAFLLFIVVLSYLGNAYPSKSRPFTLEMTFPGQVSKPPFLCLRIRCISSWGLLG
jgi:hypothetical protein